MNQRGGRRNIRKNKRTLKRKKRYIHGGGESLLNIANKSKEIFEELQIINFDAPGLEYETVFRNLEKLFINIINNFTTDFESDMVDNLDKTMKYNYNRIADSFISFNLSSSDIKEIELNLIEKETKNFRQKLKNIEKKIKGQEQIRKNLASINIMPTENKASQKFLDKLNDSLNGKFDMVTFSNIAYNFKNIIELFNSSELDDDILSITIYKLIDICNDKFKDLNNAKIEDIEEIDDTGKYSEEIYNELRSNKEFFDSELPPIQKINDKFLIELLNDINIRNLVNNQYIKFDQFLSEIKKYVKFETKYKKKLFNYEKIFVVFY